MKTDLRYTEQDYLDALEGAGPLGWQKDLKALVRELAALVPQAAMAPVLREERDEWERSSDLLETDVELLQDKVDELEREIALLEDDIAELQKELSELRP